MRDHLILLSATVIAGGLTMGSALAETPPGWVDPPSKPAAGQGQPSAGPDKPAAQETTSSGMPEPAAPKLARDPAGQGPARSAAPTEAKLTEPTSAKSGNREGLAAKRIAARPSIRKATSRLAFEPSPASAMDDPRFPDWASRAQRLTIAYLDNVSAPNAESLAGTARFYGPRVRRFGKTESLAAILAEKRRFAKRWPERRYAAQPGAIRTSCNAALKACIVRATFDYRAQNPARGTRSQGIAELVLQISFIDDRPVIVAESGRVLRRVTSATLVDARAKPGA